MALLFRLEATPIKQVSLAGGRARRPRIPVSMPEAHVPHGREPSRRRVSFGEIDSLMRGRGRHAGFRCLDLRADC